MQIPKKRQRKKVKLKEPIIVISREISAMPQRFDTDPEILRKQVTVETYRSRGPGGQRKNKTETAVRIKHPLSGLTVTATEYRFQSQNLKLAFDRLRNQLMRLNRPQKKRLPTTIPLKAKEKRIEEKKISSKKKRFRQNLRFDRNLMD